MDLIIKAQNDCSSMGCPSNSSALQLSLIVVFIHLPFVLFVEVIRKCNVVIFFWNYSIHGLPA